MGSPEPLGTVKRFTWREMSALNKPENAHVAYKGKVRPPSLSLSHLFHCPQVYDVSSFVSSHPGGIDQIMIGAGHDITHLFDVYHQPQTIKYALKVVCASCCVYHSLH